MRTRQQILLAALNNYLGDDLYRAKSAFRNCTPEQMQGLYGESGKTRQQIVDEYQTHDDEVINTIDWVKGMNHELR